ncbi:Putative SET-domain containing protein family [Zea mays]|uniref:Putative SET-domain containing protein family n=1 Tax=Zea mays TaxID=4577 RepID=A0A1D6ISQ6_MAIZE|nr:Putative SET-domain containing protein family [Zea mays]
MAWKGSTYCTLGVTLCTSYSIVVHWGTSCLFVKAVQVFYSWTYCSCMQVPNLLGLACRRFIHEVYACRRPRIFQMSGMCSIS